MFRRFKDIFFNFHILDRRIINGSRNAVVYESGLMSNYFEWVLSTAPNNFDILELKGTLFGAFQPSETSEIQKLLRYDRIFFHSPGEVFQNKSLNELNILNYTGQTYGFQHGFIGNNPPKSLEFVIGRVKSEFYISYESEFSKFLKTNSSVKVVESLYKPIIIKTCSKLPAVADCYFDAIDKKTMLKSIIQLKNFLTHNKASLSKINFHPSTPNHIKAIIRLFFSSLGLFNKNNKSEAAICWESKVKYELLLKGVKVTTFNKNNKLCELVYKGDFKNFEQHVSQSFESLISQPS